MCFHSNHKVSTETAQKRNENTLTQVTNENTQKRDNNTSDDDDGNNNNNKSSLTRVAMFETLGEDDNNSELCF